MLYAVCPKSPNTQKNKLQSDKSIHCTCDFSKSYLFKSKFKKYVNCSRVKVTAVQGFWFFWNVLDYVNKLQKID